MDVATKQIYICSLYLHPCGISPFQERMPLYGPEFEKAKAAASSFFFLMRGHSPDVFLGGNKLYISPRPIPQPPICHFFICCRPRMALAASSRICPSASFLFPLPADCRSFSVQGCDCALLSCLFSHLAHHAHKMKGQYRMPDIGNNEGRKA